MARKHYGHLTLAPKIFQNLEKAIDWKNANWMSANVFLVARMFAASDSNPGISLIARATDGLFVYYKDQVDHYLHFRKKHILLMAHAKTRIAANGDRMFGQQARHTGSWDAMWRLTQHEQINKLVDYVEGLPLVEVPEDLQDSRNIPGWVREFVYERDGSSCRVCGSVTNLHFDHVLPYSFGGSNHPKNIQLLCSKHNLEKSASHKH